jgi:hypothetical protein
MSSANTFTSSRSLRTLLEMARRKLNSAIDDTEA